MNTMHSDLISGDFRPLGLLVLNKMDRGKSVLSIKYKCIKVLYVKPLKKLFENVQIYTGHLCDGGQIIVLTLRA